MDKAQILQAFDELRLNTPGIGSWLSEKTSDVVFERLGKLPAESLTKVQLNQLLVLGKEAPLSDGFYRYYWLEAPERHPYQVGGLSGFSKSWIGGEAIISLEHLRWGLQRLYIDGLLWFGNVRTAYRALRELDRHELTQYFDSRRYNTEEIRRRGPSLPLRDIPKDHRYLISEMACKSYGDVPKTKGDLRDTLMTAYSKHKEQGGGGITIRALLSGDLLAEDQRGRQGQFVFSADEILDVTVDTEAELRERYEQVANAFLNARKSALDNTDFYLSMVNDLDVYVATSMRSRKDFRDMASRSSIQIVFLE